MQQDIYDPSFVKEMFNSMSSSYERMNYITSFGFSIRWRKQFINDLGQSDQPVNVLDILSGLGENWKMLIRAYPNASFFALDFSEKMIQISSNKNIHSLGNRFKILNQDLLNNTLKSEAFDIITCAFGLKTFNEPQLDAIAKTIHRILKPNGRFSFIEVSTPHNKFLRLLYKLYLGKIIPVLGKLFLGNPEDYKMLWIYTEKFGDCTRVKEIFMRNKLEVTFNNYFFGCASGISGRKII